MPTQPERVRRRPVALASSYRSTSSHGFPGKRKVNERRPIITAERIRLRRPIHVADRRSEAAVVVLRSFMISHDGFFGGHVGARRARALRFSEHRS
jgi:hypothetical protein